MTELITYSGGVIAPTIIEGYESSRESQNVAHPIIGRANPNYTLRPATLRSGTLTLVFGGAVSTGTVYAVVDGLVVAVGSGSGADPETASKEAEDAHAVPNVFTLASSDLSTILMTYVVREGGRINRMLDPQTRRVWILTVDFQELEP